MRDKSREMTLTDIDRVLGEAVALGVAVVLIAGGEPLLKAGIAELPKKYAHTLFVMFTNGLLLSQNKIDVMPKNVIPIVSIEGSEAATDARRGKGMYTAVMNAMTRLDENARLFGASITLTQQNYNEVMHTDYLANLEKKGCGAVFLIEYVPGADDVDLCLDAEQKQNLCDIMPSLEKRHDMLIVPLPGDEEKYDGCLASGRGFLHISSTGALEACPFAPYSDTNVMNVPLKKALQSDLLRKIRENHHLLTESRGGCALNENSDWIKKLM
jgi:MoaA/NifB/PqqE/SkfB family radical SAM enzyme